MKEVVGNLWKMSADALCITTNGVIKKNGALVMGRGCALEARHNIPGIDYELGFLVQKFGNIVQICGLYKDKAIISFPTKHKWFELSDIDLIRQSVKQLVKLTNKNNFKKVILPQPGCGNGGKSWKQVRPTIKKLDNRFVIISK